MIWIIRFFRTLFSDKIEVPGCRAYLKRRTWAENDIVHMYFCDELREHEDFIQLLVNSPIFIGFCTNSVEISPEKVIKIDPYERELTFILNRYYPYSTIKSALKELIEANATYRFHDPMS